MFLGLPLTEDVIEKCEQWASWIGVVLFVTAQSFGLRPPVKECQHRQPPDRALLIARGADRQLTPASHKARSGGAGISPARDQGGESSKTRAKTGQSVSCAPGR